MPEVRTAIHTAAIFVLICSSCSRTPEPRNVVLISIDTLRADRMSLYGGPRQTTPAIDALARRGVHFVNAFTSSPWTLPAHATMLTGRYPSSLSSNLDDPLFKLAPLVSTVLKQHGYQTTAVTAGGYVSATYGADTGFDTFKVGTADDAVGWIERDARTPFFLFFHTYVTHIPYRDRRYVEALDGGQLATLYQGKAPAWIYQHRLLYCGDLVLSGAEKDFLLGLYDGCVAAADEMVGRILAALQKAQLSERTIVVITSDHGEEFWDHTGRAAYHGHTLYNELLRVPLIWYEPGLPAPGARSELVGLVDIMPTLLARLGFPAPPDVEGMDVSPLLEGRTFADHRTLFAEAVRNGPARGCVFSAAGKLIVTRDPEVQLGEGKVCKVPVLNAEELYLPGDGAEKQNRFADNPQLADELARALRAHQERAIVTTPGRRHELDRETEERLRALGYSN